MKTMIGLSLTWLGLALCMAHGAPARPLYQPPEPPKSDPLIDVRNTVWEGAFFTAGRHVSVAFAADGTLIYRGLDKGKVTGAASSGNWILIGNKIVFDINKYSDHNGTIQGNIIDGESTNKGGMSGRFRLERVGMIQN